MGVIGITSDKIEFCWDEMSKLLDPAIARSRGRLTNESVKAALIEREMQLWVSIDNDGTIEAACTTQIIQYPGVKVLGLPLIGGKNRGNWLPFEPMFIAYAKENGCTEMEGYARPGWVGLVRKISHSVLGKEWEPCWTIIRKKI